MSSVPIFRAPAYHAAAVALSEAGKSYSNLNPADVYNRFKQFGFHAIIVFAMVFLYGCISASLITFFHPGLVAEGGDDPNEKKEAAKFNKKTKIFERLNLLFPDDLEFSPYGFDLTRGMVDTARKTADADDKAKEAAKIKEDKAYDDDDEKEHYTRFLGWLVKILETGGPHFKNPEDKPRSSSRPYSWLDVTMEDKQKNGQACKKLVIDDESNVRKQTQAAGGLGKLTTLWSKELIGCALYFSYGRGRYYLKQFFGLIQLLMKKLTPSNETEDRPDYTYITNIMCLFSFVIFLFLILIMGVWPGLSLIVGFCKNVYTKINGVIDNDYFEHVFGFLLTKILLIFLLSFVLFLIGYVNYIWQPIQLFGTILLYPISYSIDEWKRIIFEIIPTLIGIFVVAMIFASMNDLDKPIAIPISIIMVITYLVIFKDKFENLGKFIAKIQSGVIRFGGAASAAKSTPTGATA